MSKPVDPVQACFERYARLTSEQRTLFRERAAGYDYHPPAKQPPARKKRERVNGPGKAGASFQLEGSQ
jgi:hypothetical protein